MLEALKKKSKKQRLIYKNLDFLLKQSNMDIKMLSLSINIPISTIRTMKQPDYNPRISTLEPIADFFHIDINDFLYEDLASSEYQHKKKVGRLQYLPVTKLTEITKWPMQAHSKLYVGTVDNLSEKTFGIQIDTESLRPIFYRNSILIIDPCLKAKDTDYIFCLVEDDEIPVVRQYFCEGSQYFLKSINPNYNNMPEMKKFEMLGVVVKSIERYR